MNNKPFKSIKILSEQRPAVYAGREKDYEQNNNNQHNTTQVKTTTATTKPTTTTPKSVTPGLTGKSIADINTNLIQDLKSAAIDMQLSLYLSSTIRDADKDSRHKSGNAVDIAAINGYNYSETDKSTEFKRLGDQLMNYLVKQKGYTHNIEQGKTKSVLWYMPGGGDSSKQHRDHLHVSNMTGATSKTDSSVKYYYTSSDDNNWSSFFTSKVNGTDLTIEATSQLTPYLNSYTSKNINIELDENKKVYNYYSVLKRILEQNPDTYFSKYSSWNPLVGGDDEPGAVAAFDKLVPVLFSKLNINGDTLPKYHIASMNMATLINHVHPHIKELIETGDQGAVTFDFILINTADTTKTNVKTYEITWNYM